MNKKNTSYSTISTISTIPFCHRFWTYNLFLLLFYIVWLFTACGKQKLKPVYISDRDTLIRGSLYYNEAGCAVCHGIGFQGKGPEAEAFAKEKGLAVSNFRVELEPEKTPLHYFKVITAGTTRYKDHAYQSYTDRGRWAMAHYLYSLSKAPKKEKDRILRRQSLMSMKRKIADVYAKHRRWEMGYTPLSERPATLPLEYLLSKKVK